MVLDFLHGVGSWLLQKVLTSSHSIGYKFHTFCWLQFKGFTTDDKAKWMKSRPLSLSFIAKYVFPSPKSLAWFHNYPLPPRIAPPNRTCPIPRLLPQHIAPLTRTPHRIQPVQPFHRLRIYQPHCPGYYFN